MSTLDWSRIAELFHDALERDPLTRDAFLANACAGDRALHEELNAMLSAHEHGRRLRIEERSDGVDTAPRWDAHVDADISGMRVGAYVLDSPVGRGGMGEVYLAHRVDETYRQEVAVKLMHPGIRSAGMVERFRREQQILAHLDHPNIATLLDGGFTDGGRPYLIMQYVDGVPITEYCEREKLSLRQRLELFATVCAAVQAAHVKLVVHRDLKPANIMVTAQGQVKLLDFGIAKLLEGDDAGETRALDRVLTPEHAAPEQVRGGPVTTATDVYALGILLYELLTGKRPLHFPSTSVSEIERTICEVDPPLPGAKSNAHSRSLKGELDRIVMMALRKEPDRRYQTAHEFGDDIARHLEGRPVRAERDTVAYRARKFVRRNRWPVAVAVLFGGVVAVAVSTIVAQSRRVVAERDAAIEARQAADRVTGILVNLFEQASPNIVPGGDTVRVGDFVAGNERSIVEMDGAPLVQARMFEVLGSIHYQRSNLPEARDYFERAAALYEAAPENEMNFARVRHLLALQTSREQGPVAAAALFRESLARHKELLGPSHPDVAIAIRDLANAIVEIDPEESDGLLAQALAIDEELSPQKNTIGFAAGHNALGGRMSARGQHDAARNHFERSLEILAELVPRDHPNAMMVAANLAATHDALGNWSVAEEMHREVLLLRQRVLGPTSLDVASSMEYLAMTLTSVKQYDEAIDLFVGALDIRVATLRETDPRVASTLRDLAMVLAFADRSTDALRQIDRAIDIRVRAGDPHAPGITIMRAQRAMVLCELGRTDDAIRDCRASMRAVDSTAVGDDHRASVRFMMGSILLQCSTQMRPDPAGRDPMRMVTEAEEFLRESIALQPDPPSGVNYRRSVSQCLLAAAMLRRGAEAEPRGLLSQHAPAVLSWGQVFPHQRRLISSACESGRVPCN